jgi:hypothetical protein
VRVTLRPRFARRLPDPFSSSTHGTERHIFFVAVGDLPAGISLDPGPRVPMTRWDIYEEVQASLLDRNCTPGIFHLKNRGITMVAKHVEKIDDNEYAIDFGSGHGVIDGVHTYRAIIESKNDRSIKLPAQQFVKVEVITNIPDEWLSEISGALNTSIQGQQDSMLHLHDALQWIKDELKDQRYASSIAWSEQQRGQVDARELLCIMTCFNTSSYPNSGSHQPIAAYDNKQIVLSSYEQEFKQSDGRAYTRLRPILRDILLLHDLVQMELPKFHRQLGSPAPELIESSPNQSFSFPFVRDKAAERAARGALYPALAAFRWLVEDDLVSGDVRWKGGLENVLRRWRELATKFVELSATRIRESGGTADVLGKSASHWSMLHKEVALAELMTGGAKDAQLPPSYPEQSTSIEVLASNIRTEEPASSDVSQHETGKVPTSRTA